MLAGGCLRCRKRDREIVGQDASSDKSKTSKCKQKESDNILTDSCKNLTGLLIIIIIKIKNKR
jgi:hypothetical protein